MIRIYVSPVDYMKILKSDVKRRLLISDGYSDNGIIVPIEHEGYPNDTIELCFIPTKDENLLKHTTLSEKEAACHLRNKVFW